MASSLNNLQPLPKITATALGSGTNLPGGFYKSPTAVAGFMALMDSLSFYVEHQDSTNILSVTATATSTQNSAQQSITVQKGVNIFINVVSVAATTTMGINFQAQDPNTATYVTLARASLDGIQTGTTGETVLQIYPGLTAQASLSVGSSGQLNAHIGRLYRVQASITATASAGGAGLSFAVNVTNML